MECSSEPHHLAGSWAFALEGVARAYPSVEQIAAGAFEGKTGAFAASHVVLGRTQLAAALSAAALSVVAAASCAAAPFAAEFETVVAAAAEFDTIAAAAAAAVGTAVVEVGTAVVEVGTAVAVAAGTSVAERRPSAEPVAGVLEPASAYCID